MRLDEWLKERGMSKKEFSRRCGVSVTTIFNALYGKNVRLHVALKIEEITGGAVKPKDLVPAKKEKKESRKKSRSL